MKFSFDSLPKFVINLESRQDRLSHMVAEFEYMGWQFERFNAIVPDKEPTTGHQIQSGEWGCAESHVAVAKIALERQYPYVLVCEDDILFMPWAKKLVKELEDELNSVSWYACNLNPSVHRPVLNYYSDRLLDLTNLVPADERKHRGIFGAGCMLWTPLACEYVVAWKENLNTSLPNVLENPKLYAIDEYFSRGVYPNIQSVSPLLPLCLQKSGNSNIQNRHSNAYYIQRYQWNNYTPVKIEGFDAEGEVYAYRNRE